MEQILVCPECQSRPNWTADLDRCPRCGSTALVRRLGRTVCRDCGALAHTSTWPDRPQRTSAPADASAGPDDLAAEVAAAIDRVLGRVPVAASGERAPGSADLMREVT